MIQASHYPSSRGHGPRMTVLETQSSDKELRRVLAWQQDVARSVSLEDSQSQVPPPPSMVRRESYPPHSSSGDHHKLVRRETITAERHTRRSDGGHAGGGLSSRALIESPERISHSHSHAPREGYAGSSYSYGNSQRVVERVPIARSQTWGVSERDARPRYLAAGPPPSALERIEERSSTRRRSRSEVGSRYDRPLAILPPRERSPVAASHVSRRSAEERRSHHGSRHGGESHYSSRLEREGSYHTARSAHTASTVKALPVHYVAAVPAVRVVEDRRSVHPSRIELPPSVVTPRSVASRIVHPSRVELPRSVVGGRGYAVSVAPSDSVSSVGSKRERDRLIQRMRERERETERW